MHTCTRTIFYTTTMLQAVVNPFEQVAASPLKRQTIAALPVPTTKDMFTFAVEGKGKGTSPLSEEEQYLSQLPEQIRISDKMAAALAENLKDSPEGDLACMLPGTHTCIFGGT